VRYKKILDGNAEENKPLGRFGVDWREVFKRILIID
jgi:hypothetical protein